MASKQSVTITGSVRDYVEEELRRDYEWFQPPTNTSSTPWDTRPVLVARSVRTARDIELLDLGTPPTDGREAPALTWGTYKKDHCTRGGTCNDTNTGCMGGKRQYSAILWNIPWGARWDLTCYATAGLHGRPPDRCVNTAINIWGEWDVDDATCASPCGVTFPACRGYYDPRAGKFVCYAAQVRACNLEHAKRSDSCAGWGGRCLLKVYGTCTADSDCR